MVFLLFRYVFEFARFICLRVHSKYSLSRCISAPQSVVPRKSSLQKNKKKHAQCLTETCNKGRVSACGLGIRMSGCGAALVEHGYILHRNFHRTTFGLWSVDVISS